jgi:hypothetical protein
MARAKLETLGDIIDNELPPIGHNSPPADPFEAMAAHIDDLFVEAKNFLDGEPVADEAQASAVTKLMNDARQARSDAEAKRKEEAKPFDDGKAAVQAKWTPYTDEKKGRCALIVETCKKALAPYLKRLADEQEAVAHAARREAEQKAAEARRLHAEAGADLSISEKAEAAIEDAKRAAAMASKAEKARPTQAGGDGRAAGLVTVWSGVIVDRREVLKHYAALRPDDLTAWLQSQVDTDVRAGARELPGVEIRDEKVVR